MVAVTDTHPADAQRQWYIVQRWQEYEGESRANLLRVIAVGAFYSVHLVTWLQTNKATLGEEQLAALKHFHMLITALAVTWSLMALAVHLALRQRSFPHWLMYLTTAADVLLLTAVLCISNGPQSPMVVGYFLVITLAALRLSLPLVRFATCGALGGYIVVLGCAKWPEFFGKGDVDIRVTRYEQLMTLLAIALAGIMVGQVLRRIRHVADYYSQRLRAVDTLSDGP